DRGGAGGEVAPERGEDDAAAAALEERLAELVLERLNLPAERRLRDAEPLGGARDVLLLGHGDEVVELLEAHRCRSCRSSPPASRSKGYWTRRGGERTVCGWRSSSCRLSSASACGARVGRPRRPWRTSAPGSRPG